MKCQKCHLFHPASVSCEHVQQTMRAGLASVLPFNLTATVLADDDELDEDDDAAWEVVGCAIPYGVELERLDWLTGATRWVFDQGSVDVEEGAQLFYGHDHMTLGMPIGLITEASELPAGHELADGTKLPEGGKLIRAKISRTAKGAEVRTLAKDGVLRRFSVGLDRPNATTVLEDAESDNPLLRWQRAPVWETSIVPRAAFHEHALIDNVLSANLKGNTMLCNQCGAPQHAGACQADVLAAYQARQTGGADNLAQLETDLTSLSGTVQNLERQLALLGDGIGTGSTAPINLPGESYGHFLQLCAAGDQDALNFLAFVGTDTGELVTAEWIQDTWLAPIVTMMVERRRVLNLFTTRALPATGMAVPYGKRLANEGTLQVAVQAEEGDLLPYGKLAFSAGESAPVETFGGWSDMSRQAIERSGANVVEALFLGLVNRYLQVTEARARSIAMNPANASVSQVTAVHDLTSADGWIDFVLDASFKLDDAGLPLDFILVGRNRFKSLAKMRDGDNGDAPRMLDQNMGQISVKRREGETLELPIIPVNNPTDQDAVRAGSGDGIVTYEAPGAPFRLQDDDITNLTSAFSIYGYAAFALEDENALIRPTVLADVD